MSDLDELAEAGTETTSTDLADISALAIKQLELEAKLAEAEAAVKEAKAELKKIQEGDLPAALKAANMKTFELSNGMTVGYSEDLKVSVPAARKDAIIAKMKEWGYEGNVSNVLTVDLGKGNDNAVKALATQAAEMGLEARIAADIATATVKKALKERIKAGEGDDLAFFGAFEFTKATVK